MSVRKHVTKLIVAVLLTLTAMTVLVGGTYAWFVLSTAPEVSGAKFSIGAKNTVQIAPDLRDGSGNHYPGAFSDTLSAKEIELHPLFPVSTADGLNWLLPVYSSLEQGGQLDSYRLDEKLAHANREAAGDGEGAYDFVDFWVMCPEPCELRVSTSSLVSDQAGSFVVAMPKAEKDEEGNLVLREVKSPASQCIRVGFLVDNSSSDDDDAMRAALEAYRAAGGNTKIKCLLGQYQEQGSDAPAAGSNSFCIYEPNADLHQNPELNGKVLLTAPLSGAGGATADIHKCLAVQLAGKWRNLEAQFAGKTEGQHFESPEEADAFVRSNPELVSYFPKWLEAGRFVFRTESLYAMAEGQEGVLVSDLEAASLTDGATEDVKICTLQANVPQRIRMFVWLEGQDVDCVAEELTQELLIHLELAGKSMD